MLSSRAGHRAYVRSPSDGPVFRTCAAWIAPAPIVAWAARGVTGASSPRSCGDNPAFRVRAAASLGLASMRKCESSNVFALSSAMRTKASCVVFTTIAVAAPSRTAAVVPDAWAGMASSPSANGSRPCGANPTAADHAARIMIDHNRHVEPTFGGPDVGEVGRPFPIGLHRYERRSRMLGARAPTIRSPVSGGSRRRRGRARNACDRINRSILCRPHEKPSARTSRQTRRAP